MQKGTDAGGRKYAQFDNMPADVLAAILAADAQARPDKQMSAEALLYITDLLAAKQKSAGTYQAKDAAAARQDFLAYYYPLLDEPPLYDLDDAAAGKTAGKNAKPGGRRWLRYAAGVAAVLLLFVAVGAATAATIACAPWPDTAAWTDGGFWPAVNNDDLPGGRGLLNAAAWDEQTKTEIAALYMQNVDVGIANVSRTARRQLLWQICGDICS